MKILRLVAVLVALAGPAFAGAPSQIAPVSVNPTGDASQTTVKASNTTAARNLATRTAEAWNILDNSAIVGDCSTNISPGLATFLLNASSYASSTGGRVQVNFPAPSAGCYVMQSAVEVPSNVDIEPMGSVVLRSSGGSSNGSLLAVTNESNVTIGPFTLDGNKTAHGCCAAAINIVGSHDVAINSLAIINPTGGITADTNSYRITIDKPNIQGSNLHGVMFNGTYDSKVLNGTFQSEVGFGIILTGTAHGDLIQGNKTTANGIELIGLTKTTYNNRIISNDAENTGDNCISISGYQNVITNNILIGCQGNGLNIYGNSNTATNNYAKNNAQGHAGNSGWNAGFAITPGFGGTGQYNVLSGNIADDDQVSPTQRYGFWLGQTAYSAWLTSTSYAAGGYVYSGLNLYQNNGSTATSGASAPSCTSGTCSDGTITWTFVSTFLTGNALADYNSLTGNNPIRSSVAAYRDDSAATHNSTTGLGIPLAIPSALSVTSVSNAGSVASLTLTNSGGSYLNSVIPSITIAAPPSGTQATAHVSNMVILGFGASNLAGGSGCLVNDQLTMVGGTHTGVADTIKITGGSAGSYTFTGIAFSPYSATPPSGTTFFAAGTPNSCTTLPTNSGTVWSVSTLAMDNGGSNYLTAPAVTFSGAGATATAVLSSALTLNAGAGQVLMDANGTHITGTANGTAATAGNLGELISATLASGSATSLTTATAKNITSLSLGAGDWDCTGVADFVMSGATTTDFKSGLSSTTGTFGTQDTFVNVPLVLTTASDTYGQNVPKTKFLLSATTTVFLVAQGTFSAGTETGYGSVGCRRIQ